MKFVTQCLVFVVAVAGAAALAGQERPNLSGEWISVDAQQVARELTVKHDGSTLTFEGRPGVASVTLKLDGSESKMSGPDGKPLLAKAVWEGKTLVVTVHEPETKQDIRRLTWAIDGDGQLVIVTEVLGRMIGERPAPTKNVFKRR
jgi:hypothetical protein